MMADSQHFCLRWNNYQSSITSAFENLRDDEDFVDVTLACDGKSLKAHRVVLSACSPYFRELLKSTPCKHPVIVLQDVAFIDLHSLVEFIYHGEVNVHQRNLSSFLKTAEVLRVSGLTQQAEEKEEGLIPQQRPSSRSNPLHNSFTEKLMESALFPSVHPHPHPLPHSPPTPSPLMSSGGATINQLLRRAAAIANNRRERQPSPEHQEHSDSSEQSQHSTGKRPRTEPHPPPNNLNSSVNNEAQDFTTSNFVAKNNHSIPKKSDDPVDRSPSPINNGESVKPEPMDLLMGTTDLDNSNDSMEASGDLTSHQSTRDHDEQDSIHGHHPTASNYLTAQESKLFGSSGGTFNFSMAALAGDPTGLAGLNQNLQGNSDGTAGSSSQGAVHYRMPPPTSGGINEPQECPYCRRTFSCYYSLKRHFQDKHERSDTLYLCEFCQRRYRTKNSLTTHKSLQHRGSSGMLKRLLKNSAIHNVLGQPPGPPSQN